MIKGVLLIDPQMNTVIIPWGNEDLNEVLKRTKIVEKVRRHPTLKALDKDVRAYLSKVYEQEDE